MRILFSLILFVLQPALSQDILESFDLDGSNRFTGKTTYRFELESQDISTRSLLVNKVKGDISVQGIVGREIIIIEKMKIKSLSQRKAEKLFEKHKSKVSRPSYTDQFIIVGSDSKPSKINYSYKIEVPNHFNLVLYTSGGDVRCSNIIGEIKGQTSGGDLEFANLSGRLEGKTSGGEIILENSQGSLNVTTSGGDVEIRNSEGVIVGRTSGGDIEVEDVTGRLTVSTSGGDIELSHIRGEEIEAKTSGGDIEAENITGDLNVKTSGGEIEIYHLDGNLNGSTYGGDIELSNIVGNVEVSTTGGSVHGKYVSGSIHAKSAGGDINVIKIWDENGQDHTITLDAKSGDIELVLPYDFPSTIDARVIGEKSSRAIESEFPITVRLDEYVVTGTGTIGAGTHSIILRANHGRIVIERD